MPIGYTLTCCSNFRGHFYRPGRYTKIEIFDPKHHVVCAARLRDRVAHHAFCAVSEPIFDRGFIPRKRVPSHVGSWLLVSFPAPPTRVSRASSPYRRSSRQGRNDQQFISKLTLRTLIFEMEKRSVRCFHRNLELGTPMGREGTR